MLIILNCIKENSVAYTAFNFKKIEQSKKLLMFFGLFENLFVLC